MTYRFVPRTLNFCKLTDFHLILLSDTQLWTIQEATGMLCSTKTTAVQTFGKKGKKFKKLMPA